MLFQRFDLQLNTTYLNSVSVCLFYPQETKINCVRLANKGMSTLPVILAMQLKTTRYYFYDLISL